MEVWIVTENVEGHRPNISVFFRSDEAKAWAASSTTKSVTVEWHRVVDSRLHELAMEFANAAADWFLAQNAMNPPWLQWDRMSQTRAAFIAERGRANEQ
jgi:hypothetical protein